MFDWLHRPHVREWWGDGDDTLESVTAHYGSNNGSVERYILIERDETSDRAIGYFQHYQAGATTVGIDQFIGEEDLIGRGVGTEAIRLFIKLICLDHGVRSIILDPAPENRRAIRCYEKVGFVQYAAKTNDAGSTAYLMRLNVDRT